MGSPQAEIPHADCFEYPYDTQNNILPEFNDIYERPLARVVASFARFGKRVMKKKSLAQNLDIPLIQSIVRMCKDSMQLIDFDVLIRRAPQSQRSRILDREANLIDSLQTLRSFEQVIVPHSISQTKWLIYLVTLRTCEIDEYVIGDILSHEVEPFRVQLVQALSTINPTTSFSSKQRLHLRRGLNNDPVLTAYLFSWYLHSHGNYLDLDEHKINLHKFEVFEQFMERHDQYLGKFMMKHDIKSTHPFVVGKPPENLEYLTNMGWAVIDVDGDGHCGYYSLILGLENLGVTKHSCQERRKTTSIRSHKPWQQALLQFRQKLRERSLKLIERRERQGKENDPPQWWIYVLFEGEDISKGIYDADFKDWWPKTGKLKDDYQMEFMWVSFVAASKFGTRIIVIIMESEDGNNPRWTTNIFNHENRFTSNENDTSEKPHLSYEYHD
jgi:hypothetical protein